MYVYTQLHNSTHPHHTTPLKSKTKQGGYIRRNYHANCAARAEPSFHPNIGVDRYWSPPDFHPSAAGAETPRPDATEAGGFGGGMTSQSLAATTTWRMGATGGRGQGQQQPLLHRVPRRDDGVFVRLAEDDLARRERNLAALTMVRVVFIILMGLGGWCTRVYVYVCIYVTEHNHES